MEGLMLMQKKGGNRGGGGGQLAFLQYPWVRHNDRQFTREASNNRPLG